MLRKITGFVLVAVSIACLPLAGQPLIQGPMIIFVGPPGSGKSTQAEKAAQSLGLPVLSADWLIKNYPQAFARTKENKISGMEPQSDPVLNKLFSAEITKPMYKNGLIVDGYPATKDHADYIANFVRRQELPAPRIVQLNIPDEEVRKRLSSEKSETLEQRLKDYHREMDLLKLYFPNAEVMPIDATKSIDRVGSDIRKALAAKPVRK